jgi:hypothetical protein
MMQQLLQDPNLLLRITTGTRKNFSENYLQFRYAHSKRFGSPGLVTVLTELPRFHHSHANRQIVFLFNLLSAFQR